MGSQEDLINDVQSAYRSFWATIPGIDRPAKFDGSLSDLDDLCFLQYEEIPHNHLAVGPYNGLESLSLLVGQVLVRQAGFSWKVESGKYILVYNDGSTSVAIWPYARLVELCNRNRPQYGIYRWLIAWLLYECSSLGVNRDTIEKWNGILVRIGFDHLTVDF